MTIFGRFLKDGVPTYASVEGATAHFLDDFWGNRTRTGESQPVSALQILPPVVPTKLIAVGLNYVEHVKEFNREVSAIPVTWLKSPQAVIGSGETIRIVHPDHPTHHECELGVIIGKTCKNVSEAEALNYVLGYTPAQDISDRIVQRSESQWMRGKSFDTYAPLGPYIYTDLDPQNLDIECRVNGEVRQQSHTSLMIFTVAHLVSYASQGITLLPGDCIMTGTPHGVGELHAGDMVETRIGPMEPLVNPVQNAE